MCLKFPPLIILLFAGLATHAQVSHISQYNIVLGGINPAYNANIDKDNAGLVTRLQWPDHHMGSLVSEFGMNRFMPRINSSFGIYGGYGFNLDKRYTALKGGVQYAYRILFLEQFYLCAGWSVNYESAEFDVNNYWYDYNPKQTGSLVPETLSELSAITCDWGLLIHHPENGRYAGFSMKGIQLYDLPGDTAGRIIQNPGYSAQFMNKLNISRESALLMYFNYTYKGRISFEHQNGSFKDLQRAYSLYFLQFNYYTKRVVAGIGYKYYGKNYGRFHYRFMIFAGPRFSIGYSFDTHPYIQFDKIQWNSSHELGLKLKLKPKDD